MIVLAGCSPKAPTYPPSAGAGVAAPSTAGSPRVRIERERDTLWVHLDGVTLPEAFRALAARTGLAVKVAPDVAPAQLYIRYQARDGADALKTLARLGEVTLEREELAGQQVYRVAAAPRTIYETDPWHVLLGLGFLIGAFLTDRLLEAFLRRREQASRKTAVRFKQLAPMVRVVVWVVAAISSVLVMLRVPPSTALAVTGGGLLLVGLASREFAANILSGLAIAIDRPLHLGDFVTVGGYSGEVVRIGLRSTQLVTPDDTMITVPNQVIATTPVASSNYGAIDALIEVTFHVAHHADVSKVRTIVWEGLVTSAYCSWHRPVRVVLSEELWSTQIVAQAYVFDVRYQRLFVTDVTHRVKVAFEQASIPYPPLPAPQEVLSATEPSATPPAA